MAVIKEFFCKAHGNFEAMEAACPHGCSASAVQRVFLTAPGYPQQMHGIDRTLNNLANDYNMTDMKHNSSGSLVANYGSQAVGKDGVAPATWGKGGIDGLRKNGHDLSQSGLQRVQNTLQKPENMISQNIKARSAMELKV